MRDFRNLIAWQKAQALAVAIHNARDKLGIRSVPDLRVQLLRAASSVSANIAAGSGKASNPEFARYLDIALGSARELDNHLLLTRDLGSGDQQVIARFIADVDEVKRVVYSLARSVRRRRAN